MNILVTNDDGIAHPEKIDFGTLYEVLVTNMPFRLEPTANRVINKIISSYMGVNNLITNQLPNLNTTLFER